MSYDPQSGGGTEPTGGGETRPTGGSGDMQPMGGSSGAGGGGMESMGGGMEPTGGQPTMPTGGYTPPPGGGYTPPPPPPPGGYTPPPPQGYGPPPGQGYGPPPAGGPSFNVGNMGTVNQASLTDLFQSYMNALTKPNVATYEAEIPKASWLKVIIGIAVVDIVSFLVGLVAAATASAGINSALSQLHAQGIYAYDSFISTIGGGSMAGAFFGLFLTPIWFFLGAGVLWLTARMFGGTNSNFMTHSYLLSISYTPLRVIGGILGIIPVLNFLTFIPFLYQLYSAGLALQGSQRMQPGRAQLAAFLPLIVGILVACLCFLLVIFGLAAAINGASR